MSGGRPGVVDALDLAIIAQLQRGGRVPCAVIARTVGLSEAGARYRVGRLVARGTVRITAVIDPHSAGLDRHAVIGICAAEAAEAAEALSDLPELHRVVLTAGTYDILAETACSDDRHLLDVVERIRAIPQVGQVVVFIALREHLGRAGGTGTCRHPPLAAALPPAPAARRGRPAARP